MYSVDYNMYKVLLLIVLLTIYLYCSSEFFLLIYYTDLTSNSFWSYVINCLKCLTAWFSILVDLFFYFTLLRESSKLIILLIKYLYFDIVLANYSK